MAKVKQKNRLILTIGMPSGEKVEEMFDPHNLVHPDDVGRRRPRNERVKVETNEEAESWGRAIIEAFNAEAAVNGQRVYHGVCFDLEPMDDAIRRTVRDLLDRADRSRDRAVDLQDKAFRADNNAKKLESRAYALLDDLKGEEQK